ncbi:MAG: hypothetical protein WDA09_01135 [Bacteriovoracaceae bacterium]
MKHCFFICFLLLISCGSPFDEGYWKEHNREAELDPDDGRETDYRITFTSLYSGFDIEFNNESLSRTSEQNISFSVDVTHPNGISISAFRISTVPCPSAPVTVADMPGNQNTSFRRTDIPLSEVSDNPNISLETMYIYLQGMGVTGTSGVVDLACADISL